MVASFILTTWLWLIIAVYHCQCSTEVEKEKHVHGQMRQQHHNQRRLSSFFGKNTTTSLRTPSAKPQAAPKYPGAIATLTSAVKSVMGTLKFGRQNTEEMSFSAQFNELQKLRPGEVLVIGCVGDSLTEGAAKDKRVSSYPTYLQEQLPLPAYKVFNFGKGSSTVLRTGVPFVNSTQYKLSMAAHLDVVVLMLGTNDARKIFWDESRFRRDYIDIIERYQALPSKPIVFVCTPPPVYCDPKKCFFDVQPEVVNEVLPFLIPEIAYYTGAFVIDNFAVFGGNKFSNPSSYYEPGHTDKADWDKQNHPPYDGVHLVAEGNKRLADSVSWRVVESLHKANKTYNLYLHHVVTRELKKVLCCTDVCMCGYLRVVCVSMDSSCVLTWSGLMEWVLFLFIPSIAVATLDPSSLPSPPATLSFSFVPILALSFALTSSPADRGDDRKGRSAAQEGEPRRRVQARGRHVAVPGRQRRFVADVVGGRLLLVLRAARRRPAVPRLLGQGLHSPGDRLRGRQHNRGHGQQR